MHVCKTFPLYTIKISSINTVLSGALPNSTLCLAVHSVNNFTLCHSQGQSSSQFSAWITDPTMEGNWTFRMSVGYVKSCWDRIVARVNFPGGVRLKIVCVISWDDAIFPSEAIWPKEHAPGRGGRTLSQEGARRSAFPSTNRTRVTARNLWNSDIESAALPRHSGERFVDFGRLIRNYVSREKLAEVD